MTLRSRVAALFTAAALAVVGVAVPAHADPGIGAARARAAELRKQVDALELAAAVAIEDYNAASDELAKAVAARMEAQAAVDRARESQQADHDALAQRVRALYMTGGTMTLYASVMDAPDLHDAFGRWANVNAVLKRDGLTAGSSVDALDAAEKAAARLKAIAAQQTKLERKVSQSANVVRAALAKQTQLLDAATEDVRRLAEQARLEAERRAQAEFAAAWGSASDNRTFVSGDTIAALANDPTTPPNATVARAIEAAKSRIGKPYVWGATGPEQFDCSGLTGWAYRQAGVSLPRTSRQQWFAGPHPSIGEMLPGDLLFWGSRLGNPQSIHHVAMYLGGGMMIAAPRTGTVVRIQPVYGGDFYGVTRVVP